MNPYEKIKDLTNEKGISVRELEKRLGFSNGYFSKWKTVSPNSEGLAKVAAYFDVNVDYLLGRTINPNPLEKENENIPPEFFAIQRKSKNLSQRDQKKLLKLMELTFDDLDNGEFEEDDDDDL